MGVNLEKAWDRAGNLASRESYFAGLNPEAEEAYRLYEFLTLIAPLGPWSSAAMKLVSISRVSRG